MPRPRVAAFFLFHFNTEWVTTPKYNKDFKLKARTQRLIPPFLLIHHQSHGLDLHHFCLQHHLCHFSGWSHRPLLPRLWKQPLSSIHGTHAPARCSSHCSHSLTGSASTVSTMDLSLTARELVDIIAFVCFCPCVINVGFLQWALSFTGAALMESQMPGTILAHNRNLMILPMAIYAIRR